MTPPSSLYGVRLFDAALLTWLTVVPPDRVGVARKLQLGVSLKPSAAGGGGFELDLSTPDAHKTAAIFGPSTTAGPAGGGALLQAWLDAAGTAVVLGPKMAAVLCASGVLRSSSKPPPAALGLRVTPSWSLRATPTRSGGTT